MTLNWVVQKCEMMTEESEVMECPPFDVQWKPWIVVLVFSDREKGKQILNEIGQRGINVMDFETLVLTETSDASLEDEITKCRETWNLNRPEEEFVYGIELIMQ